MQLDIESLRNGVVADGEVCQHRSFLFRALSLGLFPWVSLLGLCASHVYCRFPSQVLPS